MALSKPSRLTIVSPESGGGSPITLAELYSLNDLDAWKFSDKDIIAAALSIWTSIVYPHFSIYIRRVYCEPNSAAPTPGHLEYLFVCIHDPENCSSTRDRKDTGNWGTTNLQRAIKKCDKKRGVPDSLLNTSNDATPFSQLAFRTLLVLWCSVNHRPFHMLSDPLFLDIVHLLRSEATVPCAQTISADLAYLYNLASLRISDLFAESKNAFHLAIDGWSSPLTASFLGIVVFWREGGKLWRSILEFVHLTESHTGMYMAAKTMECLQRFKITNQIMSVCLDNASNNDTFVRELDHSLPNFHGAKSRVRCFSHVTNLMAKAFMAPFTSPTSKKRKTVNNPMPPSRRIEAASSGPRTGPATNDNIPLNMDDSSVVPDIDSSAASNQASGQPDGDEAMEAYDQAIAQAAVLTILDRRQDTHQLSVESTDLQEARMIIPKITEFATKIHGKDNLFQRFKAIRASLNEMIHSDKEVPTKYVATRWNAYLYCARTHCELRPAIDVMTNTTATSTGKDNMEMYRLSPLQWDMLNEMRQCLKIFEDITLFFSRVETALIHEVVPRLRLLQRQLELMRNDNALFEVTRIAAEAALHVLAKYFDLMQESTIPWVAVIMCPYYKTDWFVANGYSARRVWEIQEATRELFRKYNIDSDVVNLMHNGGTPSTSSCPMVDPFISGFQMTTSNTPLLSSMETYLSSPAMPKSYIDQAGGLMEWWAAQEKSGSPVARMALDVLSSPATSVDAERAFSGGRMTVNYQQHRMGLDTFRAKMAIGSWYGTPLLQDLEEVLGILDGRRTTDPGPLNI
ncbi:hAT family dimerization protein [Rhizoctonia solani 123E]|uniref:HAT family dimerization protein n=1 Tax=Rhizoctonia solani 123E TaxID=1423351 RepID=A0A074SIX6_9AGAM|nr:hAT family dimerization protein [Rhizoctonia solani 123E]